MGPATLLFGHLFVTAASAVVGKAARDAIFTSRFTPLHTIGIDLGTIAVVAATVALQLRYGGQVPVRRVLLAAPLVFAAGDAALWMALSTFGGGWTAAVVYVWVGMQASLVAPHATVLAGQVHSVRQATNPAAWIGAGAIAGWIGGGLLAALLAREFGAPSLLLASGLLIALGPAIVARSWRGQEACAAIRDREAPAGTLRTSGLRVWRSSHLRSMAVLAFIAASATTISGLQFKLIASQTVHGADQLAALFGSLSVYAAVVALSAQLLITPRVLARLGAGAALAFAPAVLAAGSFGVLWSGTLGAAMFMKGGDQALRYSVDRAALGMLYRPLSARELFEGKTFIDAIVCRCGDVAGAVLALFFAGVLQVSAASLGLVTIPLAAAWLVAAWAARRAYRARLFDDLQPGLPSSGVRLPRRGDAPGPIVPLRRVLDPDSAVRLRALRVLTDGHREGLQSRSALRLLSTALAAEIVGFGVLVETTSGPARAWRDLHEEGTDAIERISRLLFLLSPGRYPGCLGLALTSSDLSAGIHARAYLETTLAAPHREFLTTLLDRWAAATSSPAAASTASAALFTAPTRTVTGVLAPVTS